MPAPQLFLSLPSPAPPLLSVHLPKPAQTLRLAAHVPSSRKLALPVCSVASSGHSNYFDSRAPPSLRADGYGRPPTGDAQEGKVFIGYSIYKGKAALTLDPRPPQFALLDSGTAHKVTKEGCVLLQFAPAVATRQYDWGRKQIFSLSVWEIGTLLTLGPTDSCEFFHDPFVGKSEEGKVRKVLKVEPTPDGNGRFFNLSVQNNLLDLDENIYIPISKGEFAVIVSTLNYIVPHLMGWSTFASSVKPENIRQSGPESEWRR